MKLQVSFIILFEITLLIFSSSSQSKNDQCEGMVCPLYYSPICGYNGDCYETFGNTCEMRVENCWLGGRNKFRKVCDYECSEKHQPICSDCPEYCTEEYRPVCGYNGYCYVTFSNYCYLKTTQCTDDAFWPQSLGECESEPICDECDFACTDQYEPVCGYDGNCYETFSNECYMYLANCENNTAFEYQYDGDCSSDDENLCAE